MSAASSWTMSAAVPPTKLVSSLSWTELTSTGRICTWIPEWLAFHESTICFVAATVVGCHTYVANVRLTTLCFFGDANAAAATSAAHSTATAPSTRNLLIEVPPFWWGFALGRTPSLALDRPAEEALRQPA